MQRQQHAMVKPGRDSREQIAKLDEVDHHAVAIGHSLHVNSHGPIVAMNRLAERVGERDEVAGAEDVHRLAEADREAFVHNEGRVGEGVREKVSQPIGDRGESEYRARRR